MLVGDAFLSPLVVLVIGFEHFRSLSGGLTNRDGDEVGLTCLNGGVGEADGGFVKFGHVALGGADALLVDQFRISAEGSLVDG